MAKYRQDINYPYLDTGPILKTTRLPILPDEYLISFIGFDISKYVFTFINVPTLQTHN